MKQRILSMILVAAMVFTSVDVTAFAREFNHEAVEIAVENVQEEKTTEPAEEVTIEEKEVLDTIEPSLMPEEFIVEPIEKVTQVSENETSQGEIVVYESVSYNAIASGSCNETVLWEVTGSDEEYTLTISGEGEMPDYDYTEARPWEDYKTYIKHIIVADGITQVGDYAFFKHESAVDLLISNSVKVINRNALEKSSALETVVLGSGITTIGRGAFWNCTGLKNINLPESLTQVDGGTFDSTGIEKITIPASLKAVSEGFLRNCTMLTDVTICEGVTTIGKDAFLNCSSLKSIVIPSSVSQINSGAFIYSAVDTVTYIGTKEQWDENNFSSAWNVGTIIRFSDGTTYTVKEKDTAVEYNGHYYKLITDAKNWQDAKKYCEEAGGYLATITSAKEDDFLYSYIKGLGVTNAWFGLIKESDEWKWVTGEFFVYSNWHEGEPNGGEPYGHYYDKFTDGKWNDGKYGKSAFICEWGDVEVVSPYESESDRIIIEEVKKYTSIEFYAQWNAIMNSGLSHDEKMRRLTELANNYGLTDVNEGIKYNSEVSAHRRDYLYMITNENYCAFDWWYWLNTTIKGKIARGLLYADGLIFNFELLSYIDWGTYVDSSYPGVEKCKTMLKEFMEVDENENLATEVASNSKKIVDNMENALELNEIIADAEIEIIMDNVLSAKTNEQLEKYQQQFADCLLKQARIQQKIESGGEVKLYLGADSISKALDYAGPIIEVAEATVEDIVGIMNLENEIKRYQEYDEFLITIYSTPEISLDMRIAAYQLHDDIYNGYYKKVRDILTNFLKFELEIGEMYMDKSLLNAYLESHGLSTASMDLLGEALGTLTLATVISNIVIDMGDFVNQAAYTMAYAELATVYSLKLQEDKKTFLANPNAENAWQFYEDYNLLWKLRYKGEEQYLDMNSVKAFIFGEIKSLGYNYKQDTVKEILNLLNQSRFELADSVVVPESLQYIKKTVIECPVDVLVYTQEGNLIAELKDGVLSDVTNEYGRFAVVYEVYSGEYTKVICQSTDEELDIRIISVDAGLVDYESAQLETGEVLYFDKVAVDKGDTIKILGDSYQIINSNGEEQEVKGLDSLGEEYVKPTEISIQEIYLELGVGEKEILNISVLPYNSTNKNVNWYSEDEEIAVVKNGVIEGLSVGETVIWIRACDNEEVTNSIVVNVVEEYEEVLPEDIPEDGIIPDGMWIAGVAEAYTYIGKAIKPVFRVYDHMTLLKAKTDYTISYKNNTKPNDASNPKTAPTITVKGKGNYKGTETVTFKILKKDISDVDITASDIKVAYNKKVQKKVPVISRDGKKLVNKTDFTVYYPDLTDNPKAYKESGEYTILVKGKGGYTGQREVKLTITEDKLMSKVTVSTIATQSYTGEEVTTATMKKAPVVKYGKKTKLEEGIHYTVSYENNINIGTATMILTGTDVETPEGTFIGTKKITFKITGTSLKEAKVTGIPKSLVYTGQDIDEETEGWGDSIKVVLKGRELVRAEDENSDGDYVVTFKKNRSKGTATVTVKGINAYSGSVTKKFTIAAYDINDNAGKNLITETLETDTIYAKGGSRPEPVVKFGDTILVKGTDYTLTYANNTKIHDGTSKSKMPTVTIKGKGNFKGSVKLTYTIAKQDIGNMKLTVADVVYKKAKGAYKGTPVVKDLDNKTLKLKTDYSIVGYTYGQDVTLQNGIERKEGEPVDSKDIVPADTLLRVSVSGKGNYTDDTPLVGEYRVVKSNVAKATVTIPSKTYTGKSIFIEDKSEIKVKIGSVKLEADDFEIVEGSYKNNTKVGTASFTIKGVGNYGGTKKVTFKIKKKGFIWWWRNLLQ